MRSQEEVHLMAGGPRAVAQPLPLDEYTGYRPPPGQVSQIDVIQANIEPREFFDSYVRQRRPVLIRGHLPEATWRGHLWSNDYLARRAGGAQVVVEQRHGKAGFGLAAPKVSTTYGEFVREVSAGNDRLYLTTQDLDRCEDDLDDFHMPRAVMAEPLLSLAGDFPVRPELLGNLVPHQLSLWQGLAPEGSSSGLHHDFHDNLYLLIRGRKRFRLFPPCAAPNMNTEGTLAKIHSNGLVVYRAGPRDKSVAVRADGVPYMFLARMKREYAEAELTEAEEELKELQEDTGRDLTDEERERETKRLLGVIAECEERIDLAMKDMLDSFDDDDDDDDDNQETCDRCSNADDDDNDDEPHAKRPRAGSEETLPQVAPTPDHFCHIKLPTDENEPTRVFRDCPLLLQSGCVVCEVRAGEMLYLPASWFHEVTSYSRPHDLKDDLANEKSDVTGDNATEPQGDVDKSQADVDKSQADVKKSEADVNKSPAGAKEGEAEVSESSEGVAASDRGHLAFNYWVYPPDHDQYDLPYWDDFWERRWQRIEEEKEAGNHNGHTDHAHTGHAHTGHAHTGHAHSELIHGEHAPETTEAPPT